MVVDSGTLSANESNWQLNVMWLWDDIVSWMPTTKTNCQWHQICPLQSELTFNSLNSSLFIVHSSFLFSFSFSFFILHYSSIVYEYIILHFISNSLTRSCRRSFWPIPPLRRWQHWQGRIWPKQDQPQGRMPWYHLFGRCWRWFWR